MRIAAWAFVVCTVVSTIAIFVPAIEIEIHVGGKKLGKTEAMSLWQLNTSRDKLARFVETFRANKARKAGAKIADKIGSKLSGKLGSTARELRDGLEGVDSVKNEDIKTLGIVLSIATYTLLALELLILGVMFGDTVKGRFRKGRVIIALIAAFIAAGVTIALCIGLSIGADTGTSELGLSAVSLTTRAGTYLMPIGASLALVAAIVLLVQIVRTAGAVPPMAQPPPPTAPPPALPPPAGALPA